MNWESVCVYNKRNVYINCYILNMYCIMYTRITSTLFSYMLHEFFFRFAYSLILMLVYLNSFYFIFYVLLWKRRTWIKKKKQRITTTKMINKKKRKKKTKKEGNNSQQEVCVLHLVWSITYFLLVTFKHFFFSVFCCFSLFVICKLFH